MLKNMVIIIIIMLVITSCVTTAAGNLQRATRTSADASFAFDTATRNFTNAVNDFRSAVINFEFTIRNLEVAKNRTEAIRARDAAFHADRITRNSQKLANQFYIIASNAYDNSIRAGLDFRRAQQELLVSPDPWENNSSIRNSSIRSNNISVDIHNSALTQYEATESLYNNVFEIYNRNKSSHLDALKIHDLASLPDELMPYFVVLYESIGDDNVAFIEIFNEFVDNFYDSKK